MVSEKPEASRGNKVKEGVARSLNNIGDIYRLQGRYDLALEHLRKSLRLREEIKDRLGIAGRLIISAAVSGPGQVCGDA